MVSRSSLVKMLTDLLVFALYFIPRLFVQDCFLLSPLPHFCHYLTHPTPPTLFILVKNSKSLTMSPDSCLHIRILSSLSFRMRSIGVLSSLFFDMKSIWFLLQSSINRS